MADGPTGKRNDDGRAPRIRVTPAVAKRAEKEDADKYPKGKHRKEDK